MPRNPLALLDFWIDEQEAADLPHVGLMPDDASLLEMGYAFARQVDYHEKQFQGLIEPSLRAAMRSFARTRDRVSRIIERGRPDNLATQLVRDLDPRRRAYREFVLEAKALGQALKDVRPAPVTKRIDDNVIEAAARGTGASPRRAAPR